MLVVIAAALVFPAASLAWETFYVDHTTFNPGGIGLSAFNSGVDYNEVNWDDASGGSIFGLSLCDVSYQCYDYDYDGGGWNADERSISYGRAKCYQPNESVWVYYCYTHN